MEINRYESIKFFCIVAFQNSNKKCAKNSLRKGFCSIVFFVFNTFEKNQNFLDIDVN